MQEMRPMQTAQPQRAPVLTFTDGAWRGEDDTVIVVAITKEALERHTKQYLIDQGIEQPTSAQTSEALRTVRTVAYWHSVDPGEGDVHVVRRPWNFGERGEMSHGRTP